jgi:hypothetical protein
MCQKCSADKPQNWCLFIPGQQQRRAKSVHHDGQQQKRTLAASTASLSSLEAVPLDVWPRIWGYCGWACNMQLHRGTPVGPGIVCRTLARMFDAAPDSFFERLASSILSDTAANVGKGKGKSRLGRAEAALQLTLSPPLDADEYYLAMPGEIENADEDWRMRVSLAARKAQWAQRVEKNVAWMRKHYITRSQTCGEGAGASPDSSLLFSTNDVVLVLEFPLHPAVGKAGQGQGHRHFNGVDDVGDVDDAEDDGEEEEEEEVREPAGPALEFLIRQAQMTHGCASLSNVVTLTTGATAALGPLPLPLPLPLPRTPGSGSCVCICVLSPAMDVSRAAAEAGGLHRHVLRRSDVLEGVACMCAAAATAAGGSGGGKAAAAATTAANNPTVSLGAESEILSTLSVAAPPLGLEMPWEVYYFRARRAGRRQ